MRDASPRTFEMVESTRLRARIAVAIEGLVDLLDELDHDPDFEPDTDDEPTLGWREGRCGQGACPTTDDDAEVGPWLEHSNQLSALHRTACLHEDQEETALERQGTGFVSSGPDDDEDSDPGGGDVCDEPHDADTFDDIIVDADARDQLHDELAFQRWMDESRHARFKAHEATRAQILKVTGRKPGSHWGVTVRVQLW
ncbi:MAG: hypothetical protein IAE97_14190 [Chthoniobacterales bacterium]|nr:hypothetical protein [Chthoniobacterales bacterium]